MYAHQKVVSARLPKYSHWENIAERRLGEDVGHLHVMLKGGFGGA